MKHGYFAHGWFALPSTQRQWVAALRNIDKAYLLEDFGKVNGNADLPAVDTRKWAIDKLVKAIEGMVLEGCAITGVGMGYCVLALYPSSWRKVSG